MSRRWTVVIVGLESGRRTQVPFCRFWFRKNAQLWVDRMNAATKDNLAVYEVERIK